MRRIVTAFTAAALALSLVATATQANAAVAGFDSAYAGESAFLTLSQGQSGSFTVFFANTGTTAWTRGASTQVDLAACTDTKTTCNAQDASEAPFNSGWLSATRYATTTQTAVAPGSIGTFTYNVSVPAAQAAGTYRFNGALVLSTTGADIHNEGYYQDVTVPAPSGAAPVLTTITPTTGSLNGGTSFTITGTGFVCTPAFPTVSFGGTAGTVTGCSPTTVSGTTPAHAAGTVAVTVSNAGGTASNSVSFTFADTTAPTYDSVAVNSGTATLTMSEIVCEQTAFVNAADFQVTVNGVVAAITGESLSACDPTADPHTNNTQTSFVLTFNTPVAGSGDFVAVTITATGAAKIEDVTGNAMAGAQTRTATATADTTKPSISSTTTLSTTSIRLVYSERVVCTDSAELTQFTITSSSGTPAAQQPTAYDCNNTSVGSANVTLTLGTAFANGIGGTVTYNQSATTANRIVDLAGNTATSPQTVAFAGFVPDTTQPTMLDTRLTTNSSFTTALDAGDVFKIAFSEEMAATTSASTIRVQDADGTVADVTCDGTSATCTLNGAAATLGGVSYDAGTLLTVTILTTPTNITGFAGTTAGVQIPATIVDTANVTDLAGNGVNVAGSADRVIDVE